MAGIELLTRADQSVVIIGAGLAGLRVAEGVRTEGFTGRVSLVGDENHEPYDRPPLSKAVLQTQGHEETIRLAPDEMLADLRLDLHLGVSAIGIERLERAVALSDGTRLTYDRLVLATGSRVKRLALFPLDMPGVFYLRGLDDALALRAALTPSRKLVVIGGGVIGLEVAATARMLGCEVVVIEAADRLMSRAASPAISDFIQARHRAHGVDVRLGMTVASQEQAGEGRLKLVLSDGGSIETDLVVVGVGVTPNIELALDSGLRCDDGGVVVDASGATSDPAIFAAGEVAVHFNAGLGRHDRQETWNHASVHGDHVGRGLVKAIGPFNELGSYWSDQYDTNLQTVGAPIGDADVICGDFEAGQFLVFHLAEGRIAGVSAVNAARELRKARKLIGLAAPPDVRALADVSTDWALLA